MNSGSSRKERTLDFVFLKVVPALLVVLIIAIGFLFAITSRSKNEAVAQVQNERQIQTEVLQAVFDVTNAAYARELMKSDDELKRLEGIQILAQMELDTAEPASQPTEKP